MLENAMVFLHDHPGCRAGEVAAVLGVTKSACQGLLSALREAGKVQREGKGAGMRYWTTEDRDRIEAEKSGKRHSGRVVRGRALPDCVADLMVTIAQEPGRWTEERIAASGAWEREMVALAAGQLLAEGDVVLNGDGTYSPA
jgi:predicted ArsR family transcriptional regulator